VDILLKKLSSNGTWIRTIHTVGRTISHENKPSRCVPHFGSSKRGSLGKLQRVLNHIGSTSMNYNDHRRHNTSLVQDPCVYAASCRKYNICLESTYIHYNMNSSYTKKNTRIWFLENMTMKKNSWNATKYCHQWDSSLILLKFQFWFLSNAYPTFGQINVYHGQNTG
jgi:hypothetical protein